MYYIGVDLGGTNIAVGLVDEENNIIAKLSTPTEPEKGNDTVTAKIAQLVKDVIAAAKVADSDVAYVGIATPGAVNCDTGIVERACNLYMEKYPIADKLFALTGKKVYIENDANAAALGEAVAGAAKGAKYSIMITLGTGVGGGIIMDGKVYSGFNFAGAELGHMVIKHGGKPCNCGRLGCWEAYSSATALVEMTKEAMAKNPDSKMNDIAKEKGKVNGRTSFLAKDAGDMVAAAVIDEYISYLACGIVNIVNIFQPNIICIGGGISNEGDGLLKPLLKEIGKNTFTKNLEKQTEIRIATLANDAGIIGAANIGK